MLVFNEGVPRSGKSYDAVKSHILPALLSGRRVYARINGLDHEKIATHLKLDVDDVRERLIHVPKGEVVSTFLAEMDDELGDWTIPSHLQNSLFVIDEVHDFYVAGGRKPLPPQIENFFALHGQHGMDGVIMTQAYKRLHPVIRARIERKNQFQKMTVLGMKSRYWARYFTTTAPDKYEKIGGKLCKYDPRIFPLYKSFADGAANTEVYEGGSKSLFQKMAGPVALFALVLFLAVPFLWKLAHGETKLVKTQAPAHMTSRADDKGPSSSSSTGQHAAPVKSAASPTREHGKYDTEGMPPEVAYVFDMSTQARPRVAGVIEGDNGVHGVIEWRDSQSHVLERMTFDELKAMGVDVAVEPYGLKISWKKEAIVATRWPVDMPGTVTGSNDVRGSDSSSGAVALVGSTTVAGAGRQAGKGDWKGRGVQRAPYTPPELTSVSPIDGN